jgi:hypothetical protein
MHLQLQVPICHHVDVQATNNLYTLLALTPLHFFATQWTYSSYDPHNNRFPPFTSLVFVRETDWVLWETWTQLLYPIYVHCNATAVPCNFSAGKLLAYHHRGPGSILSQSMRYVVDKVAQGLFFFFSFTSDFSRQYHSTSTPYTSSPLSR